MGYYIETNGNHGKAAAISSSHGGRIVSQAEATEAMKDATKGVIVVVDNGFFEAAAFAYSDAEFAEFTRADDRRPRKFVILDRSKVKELIPRYSGV